MPYSGFRAVYSELSPTGRTYVLIIPPTSREGMGKWGRRGEGEGRSAGMRKVSPSPSPLHRKGAGARSCSSPKPRERGGVSLSVLRYLAYLLPCRIKCV